LEFSITDKLVKRSLEALDGYVKKFDIQGVVFLSGPQLYVWYVEVLIKTYNAGDWTFYDAIITDGVVKSLKFKTRMRAKPASVG